MRKSAFLTTGGFILSVVIFLGDMTKQGYWAFTDANDIKKALPTFNSQQFAQLLTGNDQGCLIKGAQTQKVTRSQINTLRKLTDLEQAKNLLGNAYCQTATGLVYLTESGKRLTVRIDKALDYDFDSESKSLTNKERSPSKTDGSADYLLHRRLSTPSPKPERKPTQNQ
jgi:hypothetical protein